MPDPIQCVAERRPHVRIEHVSIAHATPCARPASGQIELWLVDDAVLTAGEAWLVSSLSPRDIDALRGRKDAGRALRYRAWTNGILARYVGMSGDQLPVERALGIKPFLRLTPPLPFNLSHGESTVAIAIGHDEVGIDVESADRALDVLAVARRFLHPDEAAGLAALPDEERRQRFLRIWTAKEAWVKARGTGLSDQLSRFDLSALSLHGAVRIDEPGCPSVRLVPLDIGPDVVLCVACVAPVSDVVIYRVSNGL